MAEWLRRLTWNQMGSSRVGSNPTHSVISFCWNFMFYVSLKRLKMIESAKIMEPWRIKCPKDSYMSAKQVKLQFINIKTLANNKLWWPSG